MHNTMVWETLCHLLDITDKEEMDSRAANVAQLPLRLGESCLRSALQTSSAAYSTSRADILPMMKTRNPDLAEAFLWQLIGEDRTVAGLEEELEAEKEVRDAEYTQCPD